MRIGQYFRSKRLEKGLTEEDVVAAIRPGFQASLLWDFEDFDDEDLDAWSLADFKQYCKVLEIEPAAYAEMAMQDLKDTSLAELVRKRREEMHLSRSALAEAVGFEESAIAALEDEDGIQRANLALLKNLAKKLVIPLGTMLERI